MNTQTQLDETQYVSVLWPDGSWRDVPRRGTGLRDSFTQGSSAETRLNQHQQQQHGGYAQHMRQQQQQLIIG